MIPINAIQQELAELLASRLNLQVPGLDADLLQTGLLDSLGVVEVLALLEEHYGLEIALDDLELENFRSVASIAAFIARRELKVA